jgi:hypothetical protein
MSTNCSLHRLEISAGLATVTMTQMARGDPIDPDFTRKLKENSMKVSRMRCSPYASGGRGSNVRAAQAPHSRSLEQPRRPVMG